MAAVTHPLITIEEYLRSSYEPDAEYVDGEIEERTAGEWDHASWQGALLAYFHGHAVEWNVRALPALRIRATPTRYRVPDVTIMDRNAPQEQILTHPPVAVFEVLSPADGISRLLRKLADYESMGIGEIRLIDPQPTAFYRYKAGQLAPTAAFGNPGGRIHFNLAEVETFLE